MNEISQENEKNVINLNFLQKIPNIDILVKKRVISSLTAEKVKIFKSVIENKYIKLIEREKIKKRNLEIIEEYLSTVNSLTEKEKEEIKVLAQLRENQIYKLNRKKLTKDDFEILKLIGRGGFGEVNICRYKGNGKIYAMKKIAFEKLKYKNGLLHVQIEKNILSFNNDNIWITQLRYSFLENGYLYLIMDYCPGGDLMNYLIEKECLNEEEARFYIAEIILCVHSLHKINCIHRDLKPDNILIGEDGHLKLSDFGLSFISSDILFPLTEKSNKNIEISKKQKIINYHTNQFNYDDDSKNEEILNLSQNINNYNLNKQIIAYSNVGSPDYVAPEVIKNKGYGEEIDWWSVGAIFYEMLIGFPPFISETPQITCHKIKNFNNYLYIPKERKISHEAKQLIFDFLTRASKRLGSNGIEEIKNHSFFKGFNWENVRQMKPPFIPELSSPDDTKYFKNHNINSVRFTNRLKRINVYFNRKKNIEDNKIFFSKFYFQYNRDIVEKENKITQELMDLVKKEVYFKVISKTISDEVSSESICSSKSLNNISFRFSSKTSGIDRFKFNFFSSYSSLNVSLKTASSDKKRSLKILPIRNLLNKKKNKEKSNNIKKEYISNTRVKLIKGPGKYYSLYINKK